MHAYSHTTAADDDHGGDHHHHHHHELPENFSAAFAIGIALNSLFIVTEVFYGLRVNSLALLSDAGHNLGDVLGLILAWAAERFIRKKAFGRFTYGLKGTSNIIAFVNTALLIFAMGAISWEAFLRLQHPEPVEGITIAIVAAAGILVNGFTAFMFYKGRNSDVNIRSTFQHMFSDALVSAGVVVSGIIIYKTKLDWIDPALSLAIVIIILAMTWSTLKDAAHLVLDAAPMSVNMEEVKQFILGSKGVSGIHDLHIWNISTKEIALTAHLVVPEFDVKKTMIKDLEAALHDRFRIGHVTIQVESADMNCDLDC